MKVKNKKHVVCFFLWYGVFGLLIISEIHVCSSEAMLRVSNQIRKLVERRVSTETCTEEPYSAQSLRLMFPFRMFPLDTFY